MEMLHVFFKVELLVNISYFSIFFKIIIIILKP
jgi:hypothetical protein